MSIPGSMRRLMHLLIIGLLVGGLAGGIAEAGKGGDNGKPGGGEGEDPAPPCSGHIYTLWQVFDGRASSERGLARVCLDGADGELLTDDTLATEPTVWDERLEVSPDGTHVVGNDWLGRMIDLADPTNVMSFSGASGELPLGGYPTFSWRVDTAGDALATADQYVAVMRNDPIDLPEYGTTHMSLDLYAFHPVSGAEAIKLTNLPRSYTRTEMDVLDRDSNEMVPGAEVHLVHTVVRYVTWIAGTPDNPDVSWIAFHQQTVDQTFDVIGDATGIRSWERDKQEQLGWSIMAVQTSDTGVSVLHAPRPIVAAGDEAAVDIRGPFLWKFRVSKFGTHALWEYVQDSGLRRAALAYSASDPTLPPTIDVSTIEDIDPGIFTTFGSVPFNNVGLSHDGSRLAIALGEVWTMDIDAGASSLVQISETIRKRRPGYGLAVAWDQ